jgi:hypothetical protein
MSNKESVALNYGEWGTYAPFVPMTQLDFYMFCDLNLVVFLTSEI